MVGGGWVVGGGFLVITVSHPTFCCVGVGVVVDVGFGCDNSKVLISKFLLNISLGYPLVYEKY